VLEGNDEAYVAHALNEALVALTPGTMYGRDGAGYIRFSLGVTDERLEEALTRLREWHRVKV
jgi:aspartate/methionine/tyrosine aminotransferase